MLTRLPHYFELHQKEAVTNFPRISFVRYRQSQHQHRNEVFLSRHLIAFVLAGEKVLHHKETDFRVKAGEGIFVPAGCYAMSEIVPGNTDFQSILFFVDQQLITDFMAQNGLVPSPQPAAGPVLHLQVTDRLRHYLQTILDSFGATQQPNEYFTRLKSMELFYHLVMDQNGESFLSFLTQLRSDAQVSIARIMEQNFDKPLTLQEYATLSNRSLSAFKRDFEKEFGQSPGTWIRERRLQKARDLLRYSGKDVTEVCYESGFETVSHFVSLFKSVYGITPKRFQKSLAGSASS